MDGYTAGYGPGYASAEPAGFATTLTAIGEDADRQIAAAAADLARVQAEFDAYKVEHPAAPPIDPVVRFGIIPDTQQEVLRAADTRIRDRCRWLTSQGVSFVLQTGDLVNWDTAAHEQYVIAEAGLDPLEEAVPRVPYQIAIGNHDTMATDVGGSARVGKTWELNRDTRTINSFFNATDFAGLDGAFEPGKIDNVYRLHTAGGVKWLTMTLEFCPRAAVVTWVKSVLAAHPQHNVVVATHYYLSGGNPPVADPSNGGYGDTSGARLWELALSQYPNVKLIFSGHVGYAAKGITQTGVQGNKVLAFLTTIHDTTNNPTRMVEVDTVAGTVKTWIYVQRTNSTLTAYTETLPLQLIRP